jgi:hypothetical protein
MNRHLMLATLLLGAALVAPLRAQTRPAAAPRCAAPDRNAAWYKAQKAWWALDAAHDWSADTLRTMLLDAARPLDHAAGAFPLQLGAEVQGTAQPMLSAADSARVAAARDRLREMAKLRTWPTRSLVGPAGVRAAWLVARGDSTLGITAMHRMMEAGPGEASAADVAMLEDWSRVLKGRKPIYASRLAWERARSGGTATLTWVPSEDLAHVDMRREAAGLPPRAWALCMARMGQGR